MSRENVPVDIIANIGHRLRMTPSERRQEWEADRRAAADYLGVSEGDAEALLNTLPFSDIPGWGDVALVVEWFETHGWSRP